LAESLPAFGCGEELRELAELHAARDMNLDGHVERPYCACDVLRRTSRAPPRTATRPAKSAILRLRLRNAASFIDQVTFFCFSRFHGAAISSLLVSGPPVPCPARPEINQASS